MFDLKEEQKYKEFTFKRNKEGNIYKDSEGNVFPEASLIDIDDGMMIQYRHLMRNYLGEPAYKRKDKQDLNVSNLSMKSQKVDKFEAESEEDLEKEGQSKPNSFIMKGETYDKRTTPFTPNKTNRSMGSNVGLIEQSNEYEGEVPFSLFYRQPSSERARNQE